jgi:ankyrin repeat protein
LESGADINAVDNIGFSALHYACTNALKNEEIILTLLEKNADVNIFNMFGESPLTLVVKNCFNVKDSLNVNVRIIETLLGVGSKVNNPDKYNAHVSAFDIAYNQGFHDICLLLINYGAIFPQRVRNTAFSDHVDQKELIEAYNVYHKQLDYKRELHKQEKELKIKEKKDEMENAVATKVGDISFEIDIL